MGDPGDVITRGSGASDGSVPDGGPSDGGASDGRAHAAPSAGARAAAAGGSEDDSYWVELRIHGVTGTPPEAMLGAAHARQVAGERFVRIFRPAGPLYEERRPAPDHVLEVLHWGEYTSGSWRQALWLLLVPFGIVNAAQFMLPAPRSRWGRRSFVWSSGLLRLIGLSLTCVFTLGAAIVLMDLLAWRWTATTAFARHVTLGVSEALAMAASAAVVALLFSLGGWMNPVPRPSAAGLLADGTDAYSDLSRPGFYGGNPNAPALRALHLSAGVSLIALLGFELVRRAADAHLAVVGTIACAVVLVLITAVVTFLGDPEDSAGAGAMRVGRTKRPHWRRISHHAAFAFIGASLALLATAIVTAIVGLSAPLPLRGRMPGVDDVSNALLVIVSGALVLLFATALVLARATGGAQDGPRQFRRYAGGMVGFLAATIGTFLGVAFAATLTNATASALDHTVGFASGTTPLLERLAYASGLTVLIVLGMAVAAVLNLLRHKASYLARARAAFTYGSDDRPRLSGSWLDRVASAMWAARLKNKLPSAAWILAGFGVVISVTAVVEVLANVELVAPFGWLSEPRRPGHANVLITLGSWTLTGLAAVLALLGRGAIRNKSARRGVNAVWDVVAFWPRSAHPFVPPPYSQGVVPGLHDRITYHLGTHPSTPNPRPASTVVLAAHSQGSLITFAALMWLRPDELARVGVVTFGSQLQMMFSRAFPAYVNFPAIHTVFDHLEGYWVNLYRDTDAIAGPVLSWNHTHDSATVPASSTWMTARGEGREEESGVDVIDPRTGRRECGHDWRLLDPTTFDRAMQTGPVVSIRGHGSYWDDVDWRTAVQAVRRDGPLAGGPPSILRGARRGP